ncbi:MAG: sensor histidine kinase, partial [Rhodobacteraceae bacterium]|nr:sensor histidine kinase [Paracoccaceae bacterium]
MTGDPSLPASRALTSGMPPWGKVIVALLIMVAAVVVWVLDDWLSESFTVDTRNRAELRLVLYAGNIEAELQRTQVVPILLSRDPILREALESGNYATTPQLLIGLQSDVGAASIELLDTSGRVVAATDRVRLGVNRSTDPLFVDGRRASETIFAVQQRDSGGYGFAYARAIRVGSQVLGV